MKKLLLLFLLCLGLLGAARAQTCSTTISSYPYFENFDGATAPGWTSGGTNSSWTLGTPAKALINAAASGTKCWVTKLTGIYNGNEQSFVESPCFNLSALTLPVVELKIYWQSEFSVDGAVLQSSIDNGATWQVVGNYGDPFNWYTDNSINGAPGGQPAATAQGWTGRTLTSNSSGGWVTTKHALTGLGGKPNVKLRIAFGSDNVGFDEGIAFDNFSIYDNPVNDAGVTSIISPVSPVAPLVSQPVTVTVKNFGTAALTTATIGWSVNNVAQPNFTWTGNLALNATSVPAQIGTFAFPAGINKIKVWSKLPNGATDGDFTNDTTTTLINACNTLTGNYTINKNLGQTATNFPSFAAVAQAMGSCGVSGPVTFTVASGSGPYNEMFTLNNIPGTSATNTITFNGNNNTVSGNPLTGNDAVIKLNGAQFIRFNNFIIENLTTTGASSAVMLTNNASNNIFTGCTFNNNLSSTAILCGALISAGSNNNKFQNNTINGGYYGIYNIGLSAALNTGNQFIGNTLKDQYNYAISAGNSTNSLIEGNDISRPTRITSAASFYAIQLSSGVLSTVVSKNRIHNTNDAVLPTTGTVYGIYTTSAATAGNENIIRNNLIYNINCTNGYFYAFYNTGGNGTHYYHNTVAADPAMTYNTLRGMHFGTAISNVKLINNIFSLPATALTKHGIYVGSGTTLVSNNNDLFMGSTGNTGNFGAWIKLL